MKSRAVLTAIIIIAVVVPSSVAGALITLTSGTVTKIAPPAAVATLTSASTTFAWDERQNVTLASPTKMDITTLGSYESGPAIVPSFLPAGMVVDSHFFHALRPTSNSVFTQTLKFAGDVVGIATRHDALTDSTALGAPSTDYSIGTLTNGLELGTSGDGVFFTDLRTVTIRVSVGTTSDEVRILTKHNTVPTANAGGPYAGTEGSPLTLAGSASDPENDPLTYAWTFTPISPAPGLVCTTTNINTLTPSVNCNDDAMLTAALTVTDPYNNPVTNSANITITNRAPTITSLTLPGGLVPVANVVNLSSVFADLGSNDTHTGTISWGDASSSSATVNDPGHTANGSHTYAAGGTYTVTLTITDDNGGTVSQSGTVHIDGIPFANAQGPYSGDEGSDIALTGLAGDAENPTPTVTWTFTPVAPDPGMVCTPTDANTLTPTVNCNDDGNVAAQLSVDDGVNPVQNSSTTIAVANKPPLLGIPTVTGGPITIGETVSLSVPFTDPGTNDTHTASINWGDLTTSTGTVTESLGAGTVSKTHAYAIPGIHVITVTLTDDDGAVDSTTVTITVNSPPTASAGGPYVGSEGAANTLTGSASDDDGDTTTYSWTFTWTGSGSGVVCTPTNTTTLTPLITCNDNTTVTAVLHVSDGINAPVLSTATLTVGNAAPTGGPVGVSPLTVGVNTTVHVTVPFNDAGTHDTHTATITWGDTTSSSGVVTETLGAGTVTGTHTYAASGAYTITVTVTDDDGGTVTFTAPSNVNVNTPPVVSAGGPYTGSEGSPTSLAGTVNDPDSAETFSWSFAWTGSGSGVVCTTTGSGTLTPAVTCNDNTTVTATLSANDGINPVVMSPAVITVSNAAPTAGAVTAAPLTAPVGANITTGVTFADAGTHDTHAADIAWDDASVTSGTVTETNGAGSVSGTHAYSTPGIYQISITITDDDGGSVTATATSYVVIFDPVAGHVTGAANFASPSGAYTPNDSGDTDFTGDAHAGFNVQYTHPTDTTPSGNADFRFNAADTDFQASGFSWLVISDDLTQAYFRGTGTVNGVGGYDFLISVIDGSPDMLRIQVTNHATGDVLYDLQNGAPDDAPATTAISQGSIIIHS